MGTRTPYNRMPARANPIRNTPMMRPGSIEDLINGEIFPNDIAGKFRHDMLNVAPGSPFGNSLRQERIRNPFRNPQFYGLQPGLMIPQFDQTPR